MSRSPAANAERRAAAIAVAVLVAAASYTGQRVFDAWNAAEGLVLVDVWVGYFWRVGLSVLHGGMGGAAVLVGVRDREIGALLRWLPRLTVGLVGVMVLALGWAQ